MENDDDTQLSPGEGRFSTRAGRLGDRRKGFHEFFESKEVGHDLDVSDGRGQCIGRPRKAC